MIYFSFLLSFSSYSHKNSSCTYDVSCQFGELSIFEPVGTDFEHVGTIFEPSRLNLIHCSYRDSKTMYLYTFTLFATIHSNTGTYST